MNQALSSDHEKLGVIFMRDDGLFEGHIHRRQAEAAILSWSDDYSLCVVAETLPRARAIVEEELGL